MKKPEMLLCTNCETQTYGKSKSHGSFILEIGLWLIFIVIAELGVGYIALLLPLLYTLYRFLNKANVCTSCESASLIPITSNKAQKIIKGE